MEASKGRGQEIHVDVGKVCGILQWEPGCVKMEKVPVDLWEDCIITKKHKYEAGTSYGKVVKSVWSLHVGEMRYPGQNRTVELYDVCSIKQTLDQESVVAKEF